MQCKMDKAIGTVSHICCLNNQYFKFWNQFQKVSQLCILVQKALFKYDMWRPHSFPYNCHCFLSETRKWLWPECSWMCMALCRLTTMSHLLLPENCQGPASFSAVSRFLCYLMRLILQSVFIKSLKLVLTFNCICVLWFKAKLKTCLLIMS